MTKLINPRLDIFTYHHRGGLGDSPEKIKANWKNFWDKFPKEFPTNLKVPLEYEDSLDSTQYGKLLKTINKDHKSNSKYPHLYLLSKKIQPDIEVEGFYCPVRLHDTYGLGFACGVNTHNKYKILPIECFDSFRSLLPANLLGQTNPEPDFKYNYMGTTWMLSSCLPPDSKQKPEDIAKSIYKRLNFDHEWPEVEPDELFGATLFEVGRSPQKWERLEKNHHVLIFIYSDIETMEEVSAKLYENWMQLFGYRHKIIWSYWQAVELIPWLSNNFFSIEKVRKNSAIKSLIIDKQKETDTKTQAFNLEQLQLALHDNSVILYEYVRKLSILKIHLQTIETNLENYNKRLIKIKEYTSKSKYNLPELELLASFGNTVAQEYKSKIEKEWVSLSPGLDVLRNLTDTIRGYVQIQQAEIDRNLEEQNRLLQRQNEEQNRLFEQYNSDLQNKLAIAGVGLGCASIASAALQNPVEKITVTKEKPIYQIGFIFILSVVVGLVFGYLTWFIVRRKSGSS
ncbi:MAG: hypothetical protein WA865_22210 [Spirulinaceae cyanobacterium]